MHPRLLVTSAILALVWVWAPPATHAQCCGSHSQHAGSPPDSQHSGDHSPKQGGPQGLGQSASRLQLYQIAVTENGFQPAQLNLKKGQPARLIFHRTTEQTCATEVIIPGLSAQKTMLPLNQDVAVDITPTEPGAYQFMCPMKMIKGSILVK